MLRAELIRDPLRLRQISPDWLALAASLSGVTPFQLPHWQLTWWRHFGSGELRAYAFWRDERLVGLVPLFRHEWNGRRQLTLLGSGISDYLDPLVSDPEVVAQLGAELEKDDDWDVADWQDQSTVTPLCALVGPDVVVQNDTPCSAIILNGSFEDYWAMRSADLRRNIKRYGRKAEAEAPMLFSVESGSNSDTLENLIQLHGERWQRRGETGMVEANASGNFLREVTQSDSCRLFILRWKDQLVAATVGFLQGETVFSYLSAFDPRYEILGFGRYLLYQSLQWALENGYRRWDFLRGQESYKASWGAVQTPKCRLLVTRSSSLASTLSKSADR